MAVTHLHPAEASGPKGAALTRPLPSPLPGRWVAQGEGQGPDGTGVMLAGPTSLSPAPGARGTRGGGRAIRCWLYPDFAQRPSTTVLGSVPSLLPGPSCLLLPLPGPSPAPFHQALFRFFFFFFFPGEAKIVVVLQTTPPVRSLLPALRPGVPPGRCGSLRAPAALGKSLPQGPFWQAPASVSPSWAVGGWLWPPSTSTPSAAWGRDLGAPSSRLLPARGAERGVFPKTASNLLQIPI